MTIPIQLAIQGGGAKITYLIATLEAVQALQRERVLRVTRIAGTSAGAIAGALFAADIDLQRVRDAFEAERAALLRAFPPVNAPLRAAWCLLARRPYWNAEPLRRLLTRLLGRRRYLGDLDVPLLIVASDLTNLQARVYADRREPLVSSLMDSAGIPFFFRAVPGAGTSPVIVDGGICENLPSDQLRYDEEHGEVIGITFATERSGEPLVGVLGFVRSLIETALNASVMRAQLDLGVNNFVIHTDAASFDFRRAFDAGLGAEYRETRLSSERFFRHYAETRRSNGHPRTNDSGTEGTELPTVRARDAIDALRSMYRLQQEPLRFEFLSVRMVVVGASQTDAEPRALDHVRHEIVFRATTQPVSCYRIRLTTSANGVPAKTQCEVFDRNGDAVAFALVPLPGDASAEREYLLFFREPILPGDPRSPVTLRVRDTVSEALRLLGEGRDELLTRASRADGPIGRVEIVVHLPEELGDVVLAAAGESGGVRMTSSELVPYAAPAGFFTLGWKGERVPPNTLFGCNLVKRSRRKP